MKKKEPTVFEIINKIRHYLRTDDNGRKEIELSYIIKLINNKNKELSKISKLELMILIERQQEEINKLTKPNDHEN